MSQKNKKMSQRKKNHHWVMKSQNYLQNVEWKSEKLRKQKVVVLVSLKIMTMDKNTIKSLNFLIRAMILSSPIILEINIIMKNETTLFVYFRATKKMNMCFDY